jgi:glycosyltransferase involved in cell wall biosynthesis
MVLKAVSKIKKYKIIIVGPIDPKIEALIDTGYKNMVFKAGYVPQLQLPLFFDHAKFTIILYDSNDPNSLYCEPNRLYQAIIRGTPVIVGSNPPMKRIVNDEIIGVVLQTDGRDTDDIHSAILSMEENLNIYKKNVLNISSKYKWEMQEDKIRQIVNK